MGLAAIKFSGSPKSHGAKKATDKKNIINMINPIKSIIEKYGWNDVLSRFLLTPKRLDDPVPCR